MSVKAALDTDLEERTNNALHLLYLTQLNTDEDTDNNHGRWKGLIAPVLCEGNDGRWLYCTSGLTPSCDGEAGSSRLGNHRI